MEQDDVLISIPEAARQLGVNPSTVWRHIKRDHLQAQQVGREWAIRTGDFRAFQAKLPGLPKPGRPKRETD